MKGISDQTSENVGRGEGEKAGGDTNAHMYFRQRLVTVMVR